MKIIKFFYLLIFLNVFFPVTNAQTLAADEKEVVEGVFDKKANLLLNTDTIYFSYLEVRDSFAFRRLTKIIKKPDNFPLSIVKKGVFDKYIALVQKYDGQVDQYEQLVKHYATLDTINQMKIKELVRLDSIQNKRVENFKNLSEELKSSNKEVNDQLKDALDIAKGINRGRVRRQLWTATIGGAVGFSVATLIALLTR